jgi:hypothetical protein
LQGEGWAEGGEHKLTILVSKEVYHSVDAKAISMKHPTCPQQAVKSTKGKTAARQWLAFVSIFFRLQGQVLKMQTKMEF